MKKIKRFVNPVLSAFMFIMLAALLTSCNGQPVTNERAIYNNPSNDTTGGTYKLVWSDEFNEKTVNNAVWTFESGTGGNGWGNNELEYYTGRPVNVKTEGGNLVITARKEDYENRHYTSARIKTKNHGDWLYGKFVARMKLPKGEGMWPAFWLMPTESAYGGWPHSGEIDIMEMIGAEPSTVYGTAHYGTQTHHQHGCHTSIGQGTLSDGFHTYSVEWSPDNIRWFFDGKQYCQVSKSSIAPEHWPFDQNFYIILNLAVGGNWPGNPDSSTVFPQKLIVDYVRVYQKR